jgi:hypothetical protein
MDSENPMLRSLLRSPAVQFSGHVLELSIMFIIVSIPAFGLSMLVKAGERHGAPALTVTILTLLEYAILIVDSLLLLSCLIAKAWIFLKEIER